MESTYRVECCKQIIAARTRKARKFFVFLRECRHELLDADLQNMLTKSYSLGAGGHEPVEAGLFGSGHVVAGVLPCR